METQLTEETAFLLRNTINDVLRKEQCTTLVQDIRASARGNLVITVGPSKDARDLAPYTDLIGEKIKALTKAQSANISRNSTWSKYIIHGIPTLLGGDKAAGEALKEELSEFYRIETVSTPKWLTPAENRVGKKYSSMTVAFQGQDRLGSHIWVFGIKCDVRRYLTWSESTQCRRCQEFGHIAARCTGEAKCAICGKEHTTSDHKCPRGCEGGKRCDHDAPKCSNCKGAHPAYAVTCEVKRKAVLAAIAGRGARPSGARTE